MSQDNVTVGWIGAGRMGAAMAGRLSRSGYDVQVWNRTRAKAEALSSEGCKVANELGDLRSRQVVFTMVSAPKDLLQVLLGENGLLADADHLPEVVVDCSTVDTETSQQVRDAADRLGVRFLSSPVSGNGKVAEAGGLSLCASGPREVYDRVEPLLAAIGRSVTYVGEGEIARLVKIAHNLFLGIVTQSMAEVTVLAQKSGVSREAFLGFLNDSVMGSVFTRYKTPAFVNLDFTPTFTPLLLRKDFDLGLAAARSLDVPMPLSSATAQLVQSSIGAGRVEEDFAVLLELQAAASGLALESENADVSDGLAAPDEGSA
ncbi:NAD(P)-dependent oxidoreductase [Streptomyces sp. NPDC102360]|uniref:NAD(P)-dependent oxidoreductase n=1 Tax=Streptomyces sp. NPDC102360 TaxID=3366160 RepID=UPI00382DB64B